MERSGPSPLLLACEAHLELCVQFWVLLYERDGVTGASPVNGHEDDWEIGASEI